jgi:hypothetical protein
MMKQYVLQNILKIKPMYSAGRPKDEAVFSSEYPQDDQCTLQDVLKMKQYILQNMLNKKAICFSECCEDACDMSCRQSSRWRYCVLQGTIRMDAVCPPEYPAYSCRMFSMLT